MATIKGGCLCGAVTYEISGEPMFVGHCACENCQKTTGSGHSSVAAFADSAVTVHGDVTSYTTPGDSGQPTTLQFCPKCGSRLFSRPSVMAGSVIVSLGTMHEGAEALVPSMLIYGKRRRAWDHVPPGLQVFEGMPGPPS
ncbi:MAG TPA: GFA family protein [Caulobacteraceae bacterium]|nr:GFA family protein [Caulobacteraceae bacterium]